MKCMRHPVGIPTSHIRGGDCGGFGRAVWVSCAPPSGLPGRSALQRQACSRAESRIRLVCLLIADPPVSRARHRCTCVPWTGTGSLGNLVRSLPRLARRPGVTPALTMRQCRGESQARWLREELPPRHEIAALPPRDRRVQLEVPPGQCGQI